MSFSTRRGRPPKAQPQPDLGTPETQSKRGQGLLKEPIDLLLERRQITRDQHWCGLHLRWLYTLRYGAPSITSPWWRMLEQTHSPQQREANWQEAREREYAEIRSALLAKNCYTEVMQLCVYNEMPLFLKPEILREAARKPQLLWQLEQRREQLCEGLDILTHRWCSTQRIVNEF